MENQCCHGSMVRYSTVSVYPWLVCLFVYLALTNSSILFQSQQCLSECQSLSSCSASGSAITVPSLDSCLPTALRQVKWNLRVPDQGSVELSSPRGSFQQSVPGQGCDGPVSLLLSETDGSSIGRFCSYGNQGTIQRVQISSSVTVTAVAEKIKDLSQEKDPFINIIFGPKVSGGLPC